MALVRNRNATTVRARAGYGVVRMWVRSCFAGSQNAAGATNVCTGPQSQRSLDVAASLLRMNPYGRRPSQERNSEHGERTLRSTGPLVLGNTGEGVRDDPLCRCQSGSGVTLVSQRALPEWHARPPLCETVALILPSMSSTCLLAVRGLIPR